MSPAGDKQGEPLAAWVQRPAPAFTVNGSGTHSRVSLARHWAWATPHGNPARPIIRGTGAAGTGAVFTMGGGSRHQSHVVCPRLPNTPLGRKAEASPFFGAPWPAEGTGVSRWTLWGPLRPDSQTRGFGSDAHLSREPPGTQNAQSVGPSSPRAPAMGYSRVCQAKMAQKQNPRQVPAL